MELLLVSLAITAVLSVVLLAQASDGPNHGHSNRLRHLVGLKFKSTATEAEIKRIEDAFRQLKERIPQIASYEWGINNSPEGFNKGCTHGFILTFESKENRDIYLNHPDHKAFSAMALVVVEDVFVLDFWSRT